MQRMNVIITYIKRILRIKPKQDEGVRWISAEEDGEEEAESLPPKPMFRVGEDEVVLYNPYEGAFMTMDFLSLDPERYRVVDVAYDEDEKVFRYKLEDGGEDDVGDELWYSEEWISLPTVSSYVRTEVNTEFNPTGEITLKDMMGKWAEVEVAILSRAMDDDLRKREIDRFLDLLRTGNAEEREAAENELRKITTEG